MIRCVVPISDLDLYVLAGWLFRGLSIDWCSPDHEPHCIVEWSGEGEPPAVEAR